MKLDKHILVQNNKDSAFVLIRVYLDQNPRVKGAEIFLRDPQSIEFVRKRMQVQKNYKAMNLSEPKDLGLSKASFRRSKSSTNFTSDSEYGSQFKKRVGSSWNF